MNILSELSARGDRTALSYTLGGVASLVGLGLVFSDLAPREPIWLRAMITVCFFLGAGFFMGRLNPRRWLLAALIPAAWPILLTGWLALEWKRFLQPGRSLPLVLFFWTLPIFLAVVGGALGRLRQN